MYKQQTLYTDSTVHTHTCMQFSLYERESTWKCAYLDEPHISPNVPWMVNKNHHSLREWQQYHKLKKVYVNAVSSTNQIIPEMKRSGQTWPSELTCYLSSNYTHLYGWWDHTFTWATAVWTLYFTSKCSLSNFQSRWWVQERCIPPPVKFVFKRIRLFHEIVSFKPAGQLHMKLLDTACGIDPK